MSVPHTYDKVFDEYREEIPLEYIRALSWHESRFNPNSQNKGSKATGLLQVTPVVVSDYNERHKTVYKLDDMKDPEKGVKVGLDTLNRIVDAYRNNHRDTLYPDWKSKRFLELLTLGWNAGYSRVAGVQYVVAEMEKAGLPFGAITVDTVHEQAKRLPKATRHLRNEAKIRYAHAVASTALEEMNLPFVKPSLPLATKIGVGVKIAGIAGLFGLLLTLFKRKRHV